MSTRRRWIRRALRLAQVACAVWVAVVLVQLFTADPAMADNCGAFTDCFGQTGSAAEATFGLTLLAGLSLLIDFVPVVGDVKGVVEAVTGRDLLTGQELEPWERALGLIPLLPIGDLARAATKVDDIADLAKHADDVGDLGRHADDVGDLGRHADDVGDLGRHADDVPPPPHDGGGGGRPPDEGGRPHGGPDGPDRSVIEGEMANYRATHGLEGTAGTRGADTLARVDVGGTPYHGTNSSASPEYNQWRADKFEEVRQLNGGQPPNPSPSQNQWPNHAEFNALARAWDATGGNLPKSVDIYVDKFTCGNCAGGLRYVMKAYGIEELRIFQLGIDTPRVIPPLP